MKIGVSAFAWTASIETRHLHLLPKLREHGFSAFEIAMFQPSALPVKALRREYERTGLDCTICAILPPGINPISPEAGVRSRSIAHLKECVETAAELGSHLLGGPLFAPIGYLPGHRPTAEEWQWAIEAFQSLGDLLDQHAITLSIEPVNRSETYFLRTAQEAAALCDAIGHPRFGVTVDTFHANIEEQSIGGAIEGLQSRLKHLHLSENDRGLLGTGHIDFVEVVEAARKIGYDGYLVIEGFGFSPEETQAPGALWAHPSVSPEDIAFKGMAYLRDLRGQIRDGVEQAMQDDSAR